MAKFFDEKRVNFLISILKPARKTCVLDIGANPIHETPYTNLLKINGCNVWGFEPQPEAYEELKKMDRPNETYLPYAIGDGTEGVLNICKSDGFTSLYKPNIRTLDFLSRWHKAMTITDSVKIQTWRLDDLDDLPEPDLLKIDVQGAELSVFQNGRKKLLNTIAVISEVAFVPLYEGQPLLHDQMDEMRQQGFMLNKFMFVKSKALGGSLMDKVDWRTHQNQMIDGDAIFIRDLINSDTYTNEQLKHLAICADAVFESFDLALRALEMLINRKSITAKDAEKYCAMVPFPKER